MEAMDEKLKRIRELVVLLNEAKPIIRKAVRL